MPLPANTSTMTSTTRNASSSLPYNDDRSPLIVIGAGILGLSTATLLQSRFPQRTITLLAAELHSPTPDPTKVVNSASYASAWAGAHYRPIFPSTPQLRAEFGLAQRTFEIMQKIAVETPEAGVQLMRGREYLDRPGKGEMGMKSGDVYAGPGDGFRILGEEELMKGAVWGCEYRTYCVNVPVYCGVLLHTFEQNGGKVVRKRIGSAMEAFELGGNDVGCEAKLVVNCSGTNFDRDPKMKIIRGQTVLVKNPYHRTLTRQYADGRWATLIPRPMDGGTIVGVSKEINDMEEKPRPETRRLMLEQSVECFPDFVKRVEDFEVIMDNVGRRPFREGGLRIEVERINGDQKRIVHGYGAGGRGYELSWGAAEKIVELVEGRVTGQA